MTKQIIFYTKNSKELKLALEQVVDFISYEINFTFIVSSKHLDIVNEFNRLYPGTITISIYIRNQPILKQADYLRERFKPEFCKYVLSEKLDRRLLNSFVKSSGFEKKSSSISKSKRDNPLVSIAVYNYNYGPYIDQCLDSIFKQTYQNFEVCISDNSSTDNSWDIISKYIKKYPDKIKAIKNSKNMGAGFNRENAEHLASGDYLLVLTSDDYIDPSFLEKTVSSLESNNDCVFAMVHRDVVTSEGKIIHEKPFYNRSCKINGHSQAAVFMMAGVNPSISQIIYRRSMIGYGSMVGGHVLNARWFGERIKDFELCCKHDIIYICEPLLKNRVHAGSDGSAIDNNLIQAAGQFLLVHQFRDIANVYGNKMASDRLHDAIAKISSLCLRYSVSFFAANKFDISKKYLDLSMALQHQPQHDEVFTCLYDYHHKNLKSRSEEILNFAKNNSRAISYDPPVGSIDI